MTMTYRCELCPKKCRLMDFNYSSNSQFEIKRCDDENAIVVFKLKECKKIHKLGIVNTKTGEYLSL